MATNYAEQDKNNQVIQEAKKQYANAQSKGDTAGMSAANQIAEAERAKSGYSGGSTGNNYTSLESPGYGTASTLAAASKGMSSPGGSTANAYLNEMYAQQRNAQIAALDQAYKQNVNSLNAAERQIEPTYYEARNRAAANTAQSKQGFNEYAAATGLNSGAGGQAELARQNNYSRSLNTLNSEESTARANINLQRQQLKASYSAAVASAVSSNNAALAQQLYNEYVRQDQIAQDNARAAQEQARYESEFAYQKAYTNAQDRARVGDYSGFAAFDWSPEDIARANANFAAEQRRKLSGGTSIPKEEANILDTMLAFGDDNKALAYLYSRSYSADKMDAIKAIYEDAKSGLLGQMEEQPSTVTISRELAETIRRWYQANSTAVFDEKIRQAIQSGQLTGAEYEAWANGNIS